MTPDEQGGSDSTGPNDSGGFVFGEDAAASAEESGPPLERRLAPLVAFLVVMALVVAGGYVAATALSGSNGDVLGSTGSGSGAAGDPGTSPETAGGNNGDERHDGNDGQQRDDRRHRGR